MHSERALIYYTENLMMGRAFCPYEEYLEYHEANHPELTLVQFMKACLKPKDIKEPKITSANIKQAKDIKEHSKTYIPRNTGAKRGRKKKLDEEL